MLRYILGYSLSGRLLARLSLRANARLGKAVALSSVVGWAVLVYGMLPLMLPSAKPYVLLPDWLLVTGLLSIVPAFFYGRALAERDLEARIDTDHGLGRRWRWALALRFWGEWAYWLFAVRQLPEWRETLATECTSQDAHSVPEEHAV